MRITKANNRTHVAMTEQETVALIAFLVEVEPLVSMHIHPDEQDDGPTIKRGITIANKLMDDLPRPIASLTRDDK